MDNHYHPLRKVNKTPRRVNQSQALEASAIETKFLLHAISGLAKEVAVKRPTDLWND